MNFTIKGSKLIEIKGDKLNELKGDNVPEELTLPEKVTSIGRYCELNGVKKLYINLQ